MLAGRLEPDGHTCCVASCALFASQASSGLPRWRAPACASRVSLLFQLAGLHKLQVTPNLRVYSVTEAVLEELDACQAQPPQSADPGNQFCLFITVQLAACAEQASSIPSCADGAQLHRRGHRRPAEQVRRPALCCPAVFGRPCSAPYKRVCVARRLHHLFDKNLERALQIVDKGDVKCYAAEKSGRTLFQVGRKGRLSVMAQPGSAGVTPCGLRSR